MRSFWRGRCRERLPKLSRLRRFTGPRGLAIFDLARRGAAMAIGALPALADGNEKRLLTQEWARAIYEDRPAGPKIVGIHYRSAYNGGSSLALWDCDRDIEVLRDARGSLQDFLARRSAHLWPLSEGND